jgi:hypothetical protein
MAHLPDGGILLWHTLKMTGQQEQQRVRSEYRNCLSKRQEGVKLQKLSLATVSALIETRPSKCGKSETVRRFFLPARQGLFLYF